MEKEILNSIDSSIDKLIEKVGNSDTIETSKLLRTQIINDFKWLRHAFSQQNFRDQLKQIILTAFPRVSEMNRAFEIIELIGEYKKEGFIKTLIFHVINTEVETRRNTTSISIMKFMYEHICKNNERYGEIFISNQYKSSLIKNFSLNDKQFIDSLSQFSLINGLEENRDRIKFDLKIEKSLIDLKYLKKVNDKILILPKFDLGCLFQLWLAWLAVNRDRIRDSRFITGFCSVFADIILGASLTSITPNKVSSRIKNSPNYIEDALEMKPHIYSKKKVIIDILYELTRYIAFQLGGNGWAESIEKKLCTQGAILSTEFREEIRGQPAVRKNFPIAIHIQNLFIKIKAGAPAP